MLCGILMQQSMLKFYCGLSISCYIELGADMNELRQAWFIVGYSSDVHRYDSIIIHTNFSYELYDNWLNIWTKGKEEISLDKMLMLIQYAKRNKMGFAIKVF
jgi:hypothetical protein